MHLWGGSDNPLILSDNDANLLKLGVIIENQNLMHALWQQIGALDVTVITSVKCELLEKEAQHIQLALQDETKITAKLMIAADGVNSWVRQQVNIAVKQKSFNQTAVVANFTAEKNHQNIARQWFLPHETLALLPLPNKMVSMVWSVSTKMANELLRLSNQDLANKVETLTNHELGVLGLVVEVLSFTLNQQTATRLIAERVVLMGDAAHQIHPMAGQGVNLGFRDVMELQNLLSTSHALQDIGEYSFLRKFERARSADIATMNTLASGLDYLFAGESGAVKKTISWGLQQLNHHTTLKKLLIQQVASISY
jgi:ubiquinone biosynthesis UbiH/UbiF/VisC/COQ6 family hydroxylase